MTTKLQFKSMLRKRKFYCFWKKMEWPIVHYILATDVTLYTIKYKMYVEHLFVPVMNHILININHIFTDKFLVKEFNSFP